MSIAALKLRVGILFALVLSAPASAHTTWYVDDDTCPAAGDGSAGNPFCSIHAGIDAAVSGDEVVVAPGTYPESVNLSGKAITLRSTDPADPAVVVTTVIDGTGNDYAVQCVSGEGAGTILSGFVVTGGAVAGMLIDSSSPTVNACSFAGNGDDGVHVVNNSSPTFHGCSIASNPDAGMVVDASSPTVNACFFSNNSNDGMLVNDGSPTVTGSSFIANGTLIKQNGDLRGDGIEVNGLASNATVTGCVFTTQQTGILLVGGGSATVTDSRFSGSRGGWGIDKRPGGDLTVAKCSFAEGDSGLQFATVDDTVIVTDCTFSKHEWAGIRVNLSNGGVVQLTDCTITDSGRTEFDTNFLVGGLTFSNGVRNIDATVTRCTFTNNLRSAIEVGSQQSGTLTITDCVFRNNDFPGSGSGGIRRRNDNEEVVPTITGSVFFANTPDDIDVAFTDGGGNAFGSLYPPPSLPTVAAPVLGDLDGDGDVDLLDFVQFQVAFTGPN